MKASYANITSTIALVAALTTGTSYAAMTLARDSVHSGHIKNGQVTIADLHPNVRARLRPPTATGGGGITTPTTGLLPVGQWANTRALATGSWNDPERGPIVNLAPMIGTTGNVEFRLVGTITKPEGYGAQFTLALVKPNGDYSGGWYAGTTTATSGTLDASAFGFGGAGSSVQPVIVPAAQAQRVATSYEGHGATSNLRILVRRL